MAVVVADIATGLNLLTTLLAEAQKISGIIQAAQANGQTALTADQWSQIIGDDDSAEANLVAALTSAKLAGK